MKYSFRPEQVCSREITFELNGDIVTNIQFKGGCSGNAQGIGLLAEGMSVAEIEAKIKGVKCGFKRTSCPDQLAIAIRQAYSQAEK